MECGLSEEPGDCDQVSAVSDQAIGMIGCFIAGAVLASVAFNGGMKCDPGGSESSQEANVYSMVEVGGVPVLTNTRSGQVYVLNPPNRAWISLPVPVGVPEFQYINTPQPATGSLVNSPAPSPAPVNWQVGQRVLQNGRVYRFDGQDWIKE